MKKQLIQLKAAYDDLKASKASDPLTGSSAEFVTSDLRVQVAVVTAELTKAKQLSEQLKDKLKECMTQLSEHERERTAVVDILARNGVETHGILDQSAMNESGLDVTGADCPDLADGVSKLVEKLVAAQGRAAMLEERSSKLSKDSRVLELEEQLTKAGADMQKAKSAHNLAERRAESAKSKNLKLQEEAAALTVEIEGLKSEMGEQGNLLEAAKGANLCSGADASEIQVGTLYMT
jgi:chromosome segregation ATPase